MKQEVFRVNDFCERYALSRRTFYREVHARRLLIIKRGRRTYVAREDADLWLQSQRHPTTESDQLPPPPPRP